MFKKSNVDWILNSNKKAEGAASLSYTAMSIKLSMMLSKKTVYLKLRSALGGLILTENYEKQTVYIVLLSQI